MSFQGYLPHPKPHGIFLKNTLSNAKNQDTEAIDQGAETSLSLISGSLCKNY